MEYIERFTNKIKKLTNGCWEWQAGQTSNGYGQFYYSGKRAGRAHRFSYEYYIGKIPEGYTVDHLCRNRLCSNPKHLEAVTNKVNVLRGLGRTAQNARKTHCFRGHALLGKNLRVKKQGSSKMRICRECKNIYQKEWRTKTLDTLITQKRSELTNLNT